MDYLIDQYSSQNPRLVFHLAVEGFLEVMPPPAPTPAASLPGFFYVAGDENSVRVLQLGVSSRAKRAQAPSPASLAVSLGLPRGSQLERDDKQGSPLRAGTNLRLFNSGNLLLLSWPSWDAALSDVVAVHNY